MVGMMGQMPCCAGLLVQKELRAFSEVLDPSKVQRVATAVADSLAGGKKDDTFMRVKTSVAVMHHGP